MDNNIDMFDLTDESYAVENVHLDLKEYVTAIIASNDEDGVVPIFRDANINL